MSFPSLAGHAHTLPMGKSIPSHTHTLYDNQGFRLNPLTETDLKEGEVLCDICNGYGYSVHNHWGKMVCKKCNGEGKLDWIERIVGKKNEIQGWSGYTAASGWTSSSGWMTGSSFILMELVMLILLVTIQELLFMIRKIINLKYQMVKI